MDPTFLRGSAARPRGHALCFFTSNADSDRVHAIYLIVSPVPFDIGKYLPPILAGQASQFELGPLAAVALPPIPEDAGSLQRVSELAETRDDDLLDAGELPLGGPAAALPHVQEIVQWYKTVYENGLGAAALPAPDEPIEAEIDADELLYGVLGDRERLTELSKLVGSLRYGLEVHDGNMVQSAEERMRKVSRYLPENYRAGELIRAAADPGERGARLAELLLQRCFKLADEDYAAVGELERQIAAV
jgi:hypothetical protein